ncbi:MAG TPA: hypothetical protein VEB19_09365 [Gemmatimonadaceae bacterium]|nr:hypothetical protein [Gemmatimonadaceae bacterium]
MRNGLLILAALATLACARDTEYESAGALDTTADTTARLGLPDIDLGTTTDTVNMPVMGTQKDTIIVDRPVVTGRKPVEVKRPTVDVNKRP